MFKLTTKIRNTQIFNNPILAFMLESVNGVLKARLFELCELSLKIKTRLQNTWVFYNWFGYIFPILLKECTWKRKPIMSKTDYSLEVHNLSFQANKEEPEFFMKQIKIECLGKRLTFYLKQVRRAFNRYLFFLCTYNNKTINDNR